MNNNQDDKYLTNAPKERIITIQTGDTFPNKSNYPGDSVNEHKELEKANAYLGGKEIGQQNENL